LVSFEEIQAAYYMVAVTGVLVAAVYYVVNLRETAKNRRITLTTTMMQPFMTVEGLRQFINLISMDWKDLDDFKKKYDSRVNPQNYAERLSIWNLCENLGQLYREGLIDLKTLYGGSSYMIQIMWLKFKPIIEMYRGGDFPKNYASNFEYLAEELNEYHRARFGEDYMSRFQGVLEEHAKAQKAS